MNPASQNTQTQLLQIASVGIEIIGEPEVQIELVDGVYFTTRKNLISELSQWREKFSNSPKETHLLATDINLFSTISYSGDKFQLGKIAFDQSIQFSNFCKSFLHAIWLVKDNTVALINVITGSEQLKFGIKGDEFTPYGYGPFVLTITKEELDKAVDYFRSIFVPWFGLHEKIKNKISFFTRDSPLDLVLQFLQLVREEDHPGLRIVLSITCLEILLTTQDVDLAKKVKQRVSRLIGINAKSKKHINNTIHHAYDFRSRVVHGDPINVDDPEFKKTSVALEDILRSCIIRVFTKPEIKEILKNPKTESERARIDNYFSDTKVRGSSN